jgi:hypothetical protein
LLAGNEKLESGDIEPSDDTAAVERRFFTYVGSVINFKGIRELCRPTT